MSVKGIAVSLILCQQHSGRFEIVQDGMIGMSSHENRFSELAIALIVLRTLFGCRSVWGWDNEAINVQNSLTTIPSSKSGSSWAKCQGNFGPADESHLCITTLVLDELCA